jgi:hypothetical protein
MSSGTHICLDWRCAICHAEAGNSFRPLIQEVEPAKNSADNSTSARYKVPRPTAAGKPSTGSQSAADKAARAKKKKKALTKQGDDRTVSAPEPHGSRLQERQVGVNRMQAFPTHTRPARPCHAPGDVLVLLGCRAWWEDLPNPDVPEDPFWLERLSDIRSRRNEDAEHDESHEASDNDDWTDDRWAASVCKCSDCIICAARGAVHSE